MGYFSELDIELRTCGHIKKSEKLHALQQYRNFLEDWLVELVEKSPHNPFNPLYDRYFYTDHITELGELPMTIQGALQAIRKIDAQILAIKEQNQMYIGFLNSIRDTSATPDGQLVLSVDLLPFEDTCISAA